MKTIELTEEAYANLLQLKNHISIKVGDVDNEEALNHDREMDAEPKYSFSSYISDIVRMIWHEQETGKVDDIT
jgi:hypothetical protein